MALDIIPDRGRISLKQAKWYPLPYVDGSGGAHWWFSEARARAEKLWAETSTAGAEGRRRFHEAAGRNVIRMTARDLNTDAREGAPLGIVAAVRFFLMTRGNGILRAPRTGEEHWVLDTDPKSPHLGKPVVLGAGKDGAIYGLRLHEAERESVFMQAVRREGLPDIDALIRRRLEQRAEIFAPITSRESMESIASRVELQRAIDADERAESGHFWMLGPGLRERMKSRDEIDDERLEAMRSRTRAGEKPYELPAPEPRRDPADEIAPAPPAPELTPEQLEARRAHKAHEELRAEGERILGQLYETEARRLGVSVDEAKRLVDEAAKEGGGAS